MLLRNPAGAGWDGGWSQHWPSGLSGQGTTYSNPANLGEPGLGDSHLRVSLEWGSQQGAPRRGGWAGEGLWQAQPGLCGEPSAGGRAVSLGALACGCLVSTHYALLRRRTLRDPWPARFRSAADRGGVGQVEAWG